MTYTKVNGNLYPATIDGAVMDYKWDNRESKSITLEKTYAGVLALLPDNTPWSIVQKDTVQKEDGTTEEKVTEWDNSEFSMSGDITDHRNGTVTIKMDKSTDLEDAYEMLIGG